MTIKRISKIAVSLIVIATILSAMSMAFAVQIPSPDAGGVTSGLNSTVSRVLGIVQFICYAAAVVLIVILGIKFMTASPDGKAEIKKSAVIYVVGAVLVFAAGLLLQLIQNIANNTVQAG